MKFLGYSHPSKVPLTYRIVQLHNDHLDTAYYAQKDKNQFERKLT